MQNISNQQAEDELKKDVLHIKEEDIHRVIDKQQQIEATFQKQGALSKFVGDLKLLFALIRDYTNGKYKEIPWWSIAAIGAALLYVMNPIDLLPDFIPAIGFIDDAMVVGTCLSMIRKDLKKYIAWKRGLIT
jgi:uncharacterized membrane protein YkvA (DUF1232 family)